MSRRHTVFGLFSLILLVVGAATVREVSAFAMDLENSHASHILVVPFVSAWRIWAKKEVIFQNPRSSLLPGAMMIVPGGLLIAFDQWAGIPPGAGDRLSLMAGSLVLLWLGGFLLTYGLTAFRAALFPLLFVFLAVPIPSVLLDRLIGMLQAGSAEMAYLLIKLTGIPVYREGFLFKLPGFAVEVAPACSGIRSAIAIVVAVLVAGHLYLRSNTKKALLLCVAIPVLCFKNAVRIAALSVLAVLWDEQILMSSLHHDGGSLFFVLGLVIVYPVLAMLVKSERSRLASVPAGRV